MNFWMFWDWKSIKRVILLLITISAVAVSLIYLASWNQTRKELEKTTPTSAILKEVHPIKYIDLTLTGNKMKLHGFNIVYEYRLNTVLYEGKYFTKKQNVALKASEKIGDSVSIKYDPNNPDKSTLTERFD